MKLTKKSILAKCFRVPQAIVKTLEKTFKAKIEKTEGIEHPDARVEYEVDVEGDDQE